MAKKIKTVSEVESYDEWIEERNGLWMAPVFWEMQDDVKALEVKSGDVWINTFPKSGTTWMQEMVWLLTHNLDYEGAKTILKDRSPTLETCWACKFMEQPIVTLGDFDKKASSFGGRRVLKTHLHWDLLPKKLTDGSSSAKIIYVARNPKDVCVSYYYFHHMQKSFTEYGMSLEEFCEIFISDKCMIGPYWTHVKKSWEHRNDPNVLFVKYEDMKKDLAKIIKKVGSFLEVAPLNDAQMEKLLHHLSFESMKKNPALNRESGEGGSKKEEQDDDRRFIRKGIVGGWKQKLSPELVKRFDAWIKENTKDTDLRLEDST